MRKIYNTKIIGCFEQGTILNGCIAENYYKVPALGIIITPRCDIGNSKVSTIHYLPIVKLEDWIKIDFWVIFSTRTKNEILGKLYSILEKYNLSRNLVKLFRPGQLLDTLQQKINKTEDLDKFKGYLIDIDQLSKEFHQIDSKEVKRLIQCYHKVSKNIFKELKENKIKEFYLLESWETNFEYYVVSLREIRKLTFSLASKISHGIFFNQISESELSRNDISKHLTSDEFICSVATLKSPHIEHLMQQFFWNFGRIGVENHQENLESAFHEKAITLI